MPPTLRFIAISNRTYTVQFRNALGAGSWVKLRDLPAPGTNRLEIVIDPSPVAERYYRLITPRQP